MVKTVFLDRDGVINHLVNHDEKMTAPWRVEEFTFMPGAIQSIRALKTLGKRLIVVTNQPDVLDGKMSQETFDIFQTILYYMGINDVYCAQERGTEYYKPNNGMIEHFIKKYDLNRDECVLVGDTWKDIVAGFKSNLKTIHCSHDDYTSPDEWAHVTPTYHVSDLIQATKLIEDIL